MGRPTAARRKFTSPGSSKKGNRFGTSIRVYDPALGAWRVTSCVPKSNAALAESYTASPKSNAPWTWGTERMSRGRSVNLGERWSGHLAIQASRIDVHSKEE